LNKQIPNYLRLVTDTSLQPKPVVPNEDLAPLERVCQSFASATGWQLEYSTQPLAKSSLMWSAPVNPGVGIAPGHIGLYSTPAERDARLPLEAASPLAEAIGQMWAEVLVTRDALWHREAELAAGVPLVVREDDPRAPSLSQRLEAVIKGGAEAIGCQAAALYLLDAATTELKLRASWGLPRRRLTDRARPLAPALADLEAMLGHAVVLVDASMFDYWKVPERKYRSCICVPVSSPSMPLGTLWLFCDRVRDFTDAETNIAEVVAGRLAADLERETLVDDAVLARDQVRQIAAAERRQYQQTPCMPPLVDGWQVAARADHAEALGGTFYDWFALGDGGLAILAGDTLGAGVEGALAANLLRGAARAQGAERRAAHDLLQRANSILWSGSAGEAEAGLFHGLIDAKRPVLEYCLAGPMRLISIVRDGCSVLTGPSAALGKHDAVRLATSHHPMRSGEVVVAYGTRFLADQDEEILAAFDQRLALALELQLNLPTSELVELAAETLRSYFTPQRMDRIVTVIKRR